MGLNNMAICYVMRGKSLMVRNKIIHQITGGRVELCIKCGKPTDKFGDCTTKGCPFEV